MPATTTVDGRPVTFRDEGDGPGAPLLLVHGWGGSKEDFDPVVTPLAEHRRVLAVDMPGHGGSEGSDEPAAYGLAAMAAWLLRFADAADVGELHLLGHSLGGLIVQRTAALASQRLQSLTLMSTGLGALREEAGEYVVRVAIAARDHGMQAAMEVAATRPAPEFIPPANPQRETFVMRRFLALPPAALVGGARNLIGAAPLGAFLYGIDIPVLVVSGQHDDTWTPAEQALLARTVAGAKQVVVPDTGHSPQLENSEYWLKAVGDFLAGAERRTER